MPAKIPNKITAAGILIFLSFSKIKNRKIYPCRYTFLFFKALFLIYNIIISDLITVNLHTAAKFYKKTSGSLLAENFFSKILLAKA